MEKLRQITGQENLCHVSNQMFVGLVVRKHLLHGIAALVLGCQSSTELLVAADSVEVNDFKSHP